MIKQIQIENYKSIREATIDLAPINVLIGANGAGKSNLISFFELLSALYDQRLQSYILQRGGMERLLHNGLKGSARIWGLFNFDNLNALSLELIPKEPDGAVLTTSHYFNGWGYSNYSGWHGVNWDRAVLESQIRDNKTDKRKSYVQSVLQSFKVYHFHDTSRTSAMRQACRVEDNRVLRHDASNLPAFLYVLQEQEPKAFTSIERTIQSVAPYFKRFNLAPSKLSDQISLVWEEQDSDMYLDAHSLSDGTLRFIALATLLLQPEPPETIVIDEPELGLHPAAIEKLSGLVRVASQRGAQVLVATQSSSLVSCFEPEDILVVERQGGSTVFSRPDKERLASWLEDYSLGELWEKNLIGGKP